MPIVVIFPPIEISPAVVILKLLRFVEFPIVAAKLTAPLVELIVKACPPLMVEVFPIKLIEPDVEDRVTALVRVIGAVND